jgi:capsular polysaccharide transport system permease protein
VDDPLLVILGLLLAGALGGSFGAALCSLTVYSNSVDKVANALLRPMMFMSGTFFALEDMPPQLADYLVFNPMLHVVELVRDGWFPTYTSTRVNAWYPSIWIGGFTILALTLERVVRPKLQVT